MSDPYGTATTAIKDALVTIVRSTSTFDDTNAHADFVRETNVNPRCRVRLRRDSLEDIGPMETRHILNFEIWIQYLANYVEATLDQMIDYVGEIVDAIEGTRNLGSSYIENTEVITVDYSFRQDQSALLYHGVIIVEVEALRNV
jgi:hypothetical protein